MKGLLSAILFLLLSIAQTKGQTFKWAQKMGSTSSDVARFLAVDNSGNTYVIGRFSGTMIFPGGGSVASRSLVSAGSNDFYVAKFDCSRNMVWKNSIGSISADGGFYNYLSLKYDNAGMIYITGTFTSAAAFNTTSGTGITLTSNGGYDAFLAKYDTTGAIQWALKCGGASNDEGMDVCINHAGDILFGGYFQGLSTFGTTSGSTITKNTSGNEEIFIAKYSPSGVLNWVTIGNGPVQDLLTSIAVDRTDQIYVTLISFGASTLTLGSINVVNTAGWGTNMAKLTNDGNWIWAYGMGGAAHELLGRVVVDDSCNVYGTGHFIGGNAVFSSAPPGSGITIVNKGNWDPYIVGLDSSGVLKWARSIGGTGLDYGWHVNLTKSNNLIFTGNFSNTVNFGNGLNMTSAGTTDGYICFVDRITGNTQGGLRFGGSSDDYGHASVSDNSGNIYVCGFFSNSADFGTTILNSTGSEESFIAKIGPLTYFPITAFPGTDLCIFDSVFLFPVSHQNNVTYQWLKNGTVLPGEINDTLITKDTGFYRIVYLNDCNEYDTSLAIQVTIGSLTVNAGADRIVCAGDSTQLQATGAVTYIWSPSDFLNDTTIANPYCKPSTAKTYIVKGTSGSCVDYDTISVFISSPVITAGIDKSICEGDSVQLLATGAAFFKWTPTTGLSDSLVANPYCKVTDSITYIVRGNTGSCFAYDTIHIDVIHINVDADTDKSICPGDSIQLNGTASGAAIWSPTGTLSNPNIVNPYAKPAITTKYYLTTNNAGCTRTDSVTVFVSSTTSVDAGTDVAICSGKSVILNATGGLTYSWSPYYYIDDTTISNPTVSPLVTTDYIVKSGNGACPAYDTVKVTVNPVPVVDAGTDLLVCSYETGIFTATENGIADQFVWTPASGLNDPTILTPSVTGTTSEWYFLTARNSITGCEAKDSVLFTPDSVVALFTANPMEGTAPLTVSFTNQSLYASSYLWYFDSSGASSMLTNPQFVYTTSGTFQPILIAQNSNGCLDTFSLTIEVLSDQIIYVPNVFTPNKDGHNEQFIISVMNYGLLKKMQGSIWNRWGAKIYEWSIPGGNWWDGTHKGILCQQDVYVYIIEVEDIYGKKKEYKGTVTLLR